MGTRFVASVESPVHPNYKEAIVAAGVDGTIVLPRPPRAKMRTLRTRAALDMIEGVESRGSCGSVIDALYIGGDVDNTAGSAGLSSALIHEIKPVQAIVDDTLSGFWREIDRLAGLRGAPRQ